MMRPSSIPATEYRRYTLKMSRLGTVSGSKASSADDSWIANQREACSSSSSSCVNMRTVCVLSRLGKRVLSSRTWRGGGTGGAVEDFGAAGFAAGGRAGSPCSAVRTGAEMTDAVTDAAGFAVGGRTGSLCSAVRTGGEMTDGATNAAGFAAGLGGATNAAGFAAGLGGATNAAGFAAGLGGATDAAGFAAGLGG